MEMRKEQFNSKFDIIDNEREKIMGVKFNDCA